jgi:hypothetical protein
MQDPQGDNLHPGGPSCLFKQCRAALPLEAVAHVGPVNRCMQGMGNNVLNFALLFETFIAAAVVYIPPLNTGEWASSGGSARPLTAA